MYDILVSLGGIIGVTVILSVAIFSVGRLRIERQRTLQKLLDRGMAVDELVHAAGLSAPVDLDRRRGLLLLAVGVAWSVVTFLIGGRAWILGMFPVALGLVFILLWLLDGRRR